VTVAELAAGPHATSDEEERAQRRDRLHWVATSWDPLPFDTDAARDWYDLIRFLERGASTVGPEDRFTASGL